MSSLRDQLQPHVDRAMQLHQQGRLAEAEHIYRQVLQHDPTNPARRLHLFGLIAQPTGHAAAAAELMERAIAEEPRIPLYRINLTKVYRGAGRIDDALASARRAVELGPRFVDGRVLQCCAKTGGGGARAAGGAQARARSSRSAQH